MKGLKWKAFSTAEKIPSMTEDTAALSSPADCSESKVKFGFSQVEAQEKKVRRYMTTRGDVRN